MQLQEQYMKHCSTFKHKSNSTKKVIYHYKLPQNLKPSYLKPKPQINIQIQYAFKFYNVS